MKFKNRYTGEIMNWRNSNMRNVVRRLLASSLCLMVLVPGLCFAASAEEPTATSSAPYEVNDDIECTGYTDFSNPVMFQAEGSSLTYKCFLIDLNGIRRYVAVDEEKYPYFESAFKGKPMTFEGTYAGAMSDGTPVVRPITLIEGETRTNLLKYLWNINKGPDNDLNFKVYEILYDISFIKAGDDNSYITFDSNPFNLDSDSPAALIDAIAAPPFLETMNENFGLPDWLYEEMVGTRALDGMQKEVFEHLTVSWTYHPDQGLEVLYRKN